MQYTSLFLARGLAKLSAAKPVLEKPVKLGQVKIARRWLPDQDLVKLCRKVREKKPNS